MRKLEPLMVISLIVLITIVFLSKKERQIDCIELCIAETEYSTEYMRSIDTTSRINTFTLDTVKISSKPDEKEINRIKTTIEKLTNQKKRKTGVVIYLTDTNYSGFIKVLDIFIKNKISIVCFDEDKIIYFPNRPSREYMTNRLHINKKFLMN